MDAITSLSFNLSNVQINDPLERSLSTLLGSNTFNELGLLPSVFTPELQEQWKTIIEPALLKGLKDTNLHPLLLETIHELAKRKYDLNQPIFDPIDPICPDTTVARPLMYLACAKGVDCFHIMYEMMKMENIDINATTTHGANLFWLAAYDGHLDLIELLLNDVRINPNKPKNDHATPFSTACVMGHFQVVDRLLKDKRIDPNKPNILGGTPLSLACYKGNIEVVTSLLRDPRVDPNQATNDAATPFYFACQQGNTKIVESLLEDSRLDPKKQNTDGASPFYSACRNGRIEVVKCLLRDERVDPNQNCNDGWFPFLIACFNGHLETIKILLESTRVDPTKVLSGGWSPFFYVNNDNIGILELLLSDGRLDPNKANQVGTTPLADACVNKNLDVVKRFLNNERVDPNLHTESTPSALIRSIRERKFDALKILLKNPRVQIIDSDQMYQAFVSLLTDNCKDGAEIILAMSSKRPDLEGVIIRLTNHIESTIENLNADNKVKQLLVDYTKDPVLRQKISLALYAKHFGVEESANLFAATVLTCDDLLAFKTNVEAQNWFRFMRIATRLPLELQMVLSNRTWGISKDLVATKDLENALREVLKIFKR